MSAALKDRGDARVIVLAGPDAVRTVKPADWSIVTDKDGALAAELEVRGYPTILVLKPDGLEIARIAGSAESLAVKLPAYLDLAAGKIDAAQVQNKLVTRDLVGDGPDKQAARDVRTIELLIDTNKPADALTLLMKLPDGAIPNWRHNYLGARILIGLNRWPDAKDAARAALQQNPRLLEAHFLLGQIYEHEQNWQQAAAEYRAAGKSR
jgi:thioredoxin-like negative regulator of GroEL